VYINRVYHSKFKFFNASEEEVRHAHIHSERADNNSHRLSKRFGHPALHAELFTPMLHSKLMPLLSEVYSGRINHEQMKLDEYGGQKMEAHLVPGGIKIAAIDQVIAPGSL
jgi:calcium permeable stress-gated cation channel